MTVRGSVGFVSFLLTPAATHPCSAHDGADSQHQHAARFGYDGRVAVTRVTGIARRIATGRIVAGISGIRRLTGRHIHIWFIRSAEEATAASIGSGVAAVRVHIVLALAAARTVALAGAVALAGTVALARTVAVALARTVAFAGAVSGILDLA